MEELGIRLKTEANLEALTEEVTKSSEIEGEVLSDEQVRSSLAVVSESISTPSPLPSATSKASWR